jgi:hypothetical protein
VNHQPDENGKLKDDKMKGLPVLLKAKNHGFVVVHFDFSGPFGSAAAHC